ncbi:MAG: DUF1697 domain-containing protein [Candidatus Moraniibacteriota bacterium]
MNTYIVLIRGINVGGKNKMPMSKLKAVLEEQGFSDVSTYIASGNVILKSKIRSTEIRDTIEKVLPKNFDLDNKLLKVLVLTRKQLQSIIHNKPRGFGEQPDKYHCDAIFLIGIRAEKTIGLFSPREGIDKIWPGDGVIYSQRLSALRTKSRLNKIMSTPEYQLMTIRNWNTTLKLLELSRPQ